MAVARLGNGDEAVELFHLLNPINHTRAARTSKRYKAEPYVTAGDVYAHRPTRARRVDVVQRAPRAGCTAAGLESILGLKRHGASFELESCNPRGLARVFIVWRFGRTGYEHLRFQTRSTAAGDSRGARLDGHPWIPPAIPLVDDGVTHRCAWWWGAGGPSTPTQPAGDGGAGVKPMSGRLLHLNSRYP